MLCGTRAGTAEAAGADQVSARAVPARLRHSAALLAAGLLTVLALPGMADEASRVHGLWVWKGPALLAAPQGAQRLGDFCRSQDINEVYVSILSAGQLADAAAVAQLIRELHGVHVRVEALLSSTDADQAGKHRDKLLEHVRSIIQFDQAHPQERFDGIHLDIEPQQRAENKGAGNLQFLPGLAAAYAAVRALATPAALSVNADIQNKLLKGSVAERRLLLTALPRLTLMLYELSGPSDGTNSEQQAQKLRAASEQYLQMAYAQLTGADLATLVIGLRTPDYGAQLPQMLQVVDAANRGDRHYAGWARHSYNDTLTER
jgi:hypothetical protein